MIHDHSLPDFLPRNVVISSMPKVRRLPIGLGVNIAGLFEDKPQADGTFAIVAIFIEIFLVGLTLQALEPLYQLAAIFCAISIDLSCAYLHHKFSADGSLQLRRDLAAYSARINKNQDLTNRYEDQLSKSKKKSLIFGSLLVISACAKIWLFMVAVDFNFDIISVAGVVGYIIVAAIHLFKTGYALAYVTSAGVFGIWGYSKDRNLHRSNPDRLRAGSFPFTLPDGLVFQQMLSSPTFARTAGKDLKPDIRIHHVGKHELRSSGHGDSIVIHAHGLLYNDDIRQLMAIPELNQKAQEEIAYACLYIQLNINYNNQGVNND